ncbi:unnamed protein product [Paramecium sonneborni]|uniref:Uncharacterized protein n=1 Tax=Paramecium sonneborni TaxID=65129 RepID=A0A8S1R8H9_9CILI|nr:unnamed protein product [Paramecium sonneborni]
MQDQVKELIEEIIPNIRVEVIKEQNSFKQNKKSQIHNLLLAQQIMNQIEQEFEQDKQSLIRTFSLSLSQSRSMQVLEQQGIKIKNIKRIHRICRRRSKIKNHNLIKLNCQKKYDEERIEMKNLMTNEFTEKLQIHLEQLEQTKSQLTIDYLNQREKLLRIEAETKKFQSQKENQENVYGSQIQEIYEQIKIIQDQLSQIKKNRQFNLSKMKHNLNNHHINLQFKNQILKECFVYEGLNIVNFDDLPEKYYLKIKPNIFDQKQEIQNMIPQKMNQIILKNKIQSKQQILKLILLILKNNIIQCFQLSIVKNTIYQTKLQNFTNTTLQKQQFSQHQQIQKQQLIQQEKENDPSIQKLLIIQKIQFRQLNNQILIDQSINNNKKLENFVKQNQINLKVLIIRDHLKSNYHKIILKNFLDNQTTKNIELLRQEFQTKFLEDIQLEDYYFQQITYFKLKVIQQFPKNQQSQIAEQILELISIWNKGQFIFF